MDFLFSAIVQLLNCVRLLVTPWTAAYQASLTITIPKVYANSCPLSWWCHSTISSSVAQFSYCPQSLQASGTFPMSQLFPSLQSLSQADSFRPRGPQLARPPSPSPNLRVCSNSCPLSWWCHPTISSSVVPFFCLQSFPASGSFQMSHLFASGGQNIGFQLQHQSFQWTPRTDIL